MQKILSLFLTLVTVAAACSHKSKPAGAGGATSCTMCACVEFASAGGCVDICDGTVNGTGVDNFCNGAAALDQCAACIASSCGSDPASCT